MSVSMKSGLEGRNNGIVGQLQGESEVSLNEVRPRRPEQYIARSTLVTERVIGLNEVRPRRPEQ